MTAELFDLVSHALRPVDVMNQRSKPRAARDAALRWAEFPLNERGWCLHLGYAFAGDPDDDGDITIHKIVLNTGQRDIDLTPADLDGDTFFACEEQCREEWRASYEDRP